MMQSNTASPLAPLPVVLLVEDDEVDVRCVRRALRDQCIQNPLQVARNGREALAYLESLKHGQTAEWPNLICLDLNMPVMNGWEFLRAIKQDTQFSAIPVVLMTSSDDNREATAAFKLGAAGYFQKPFEFERYAALLQIVFSYWNHSHLPGVIHVDPA